MLYWFCKHYNKYKKCRGSYREFGWKIMGVYFASCSVCQCAVLIKADGGRHETVEERGCCTAVLSGEPGVAPSLYSTKIIGIIF